MKASQFDKKFDDNKQDIIDDFDLSSITSPIESKNESMLVLLPRSSIRWIEKPAASVLHVNRSLNFGWWSVLRKRRLTVSRELSETHRCCNKRHFPNSLA